MAEYERPQVTALRQRLAEPPRTITVVSGPRQSGKTTLVTQALRTVAGPQIYKDIDQAGTGDWSTLAPATPVVEPEGMTGVDRDRGWLVDVWREARDVADRYGSCVLVLDEIQNIDRWTSVVKGLWDADRRRRRPLHAVILGSAPLAIQAGLTEGLTGRFELIRCTHWSLAEMTEAFGVDLPGYLYFGGYPGAARLIPSLPSDQPRDESLWRQYILDSLIEPSITKDVLAMTRIDKPALLRQLVETGASYSGQIVALAKLLGQLQDAGNTTTLARYLELLRTVGLFAGLSKYDGSAIRRRKSPPKLLAMNTAVMTANSDYDFRAAREDRTYWGRLVETAAGAHLLNTAQSGMHVHYWRQGNDEVDFVLTWYQRVVGIEVKSGAQHGRTRGMAAFERKVRPERVILVATHDSGSETIPLVEFLSRPATDWFENAE